MEEVGSRRMSKKNKNIIERLLEFFSQLIYAFSFYMQELKEKLIGGENKSKKTKKSQKKRKTTKSSDLQKSNQREGEKTKSSQRVREENKSKSNQTTTVRQVSIEDIWEAIQEEQRQQEKIKNISNIYEVGSKSKPKSHITEISLEEIRKKREQAKEQEKIEAKFQESAIKEQKPVEPVHKVETPKVKLEVEKKVEKVEKPKKTAAKKEKDWLKKQLKDLEEKKKKLEESAKKRFSSKKPENSAEDIQRVEEKDVFDNKSIDEQMTRTLEKEIVPRQEEIVRKQEKIEQDNTLEELKKKQEEQLELIRKKQQEQEEQKIQLEEFRKKQQEQSRLQAEARKQREQQQLEEKIKRQQRLEELQRKEQEEIEALKREKEQADLELRRISQQEQDQLAVLRRKQQEKAQLENLRLAQDKKREEELRLVQEEKNREEALRLAQEEKNREEALRLVQEELRIKQEQEMLAEKNDELGQSPVIENERKEWSEDELTDEENQGFKKRDFGWIRSGTVAALFVIILMIGGNFIGNKFSSNVNTTPTIESTAEGNKTTPVSQEESSATLSFVGDLICHMPQFRDAYDVKTGEYNFSKCFSQVDQYLQEADLTIGNLETVFAGKEQNYSGYPTFNTPDDFARTLKEVGFDILTTANNHCFDRGKTGIVRTLDVLDEVGISHMGTYRNAQEKNNIIIKEVNGIKFAFVSFTTFINMGTNIATDNINYLTQEEVKSQIQLAKAQNPDCIVAMPHWGTEYETTPNDEQKQAADMLIEAGADIIVGSHPHVVQKMGKKKVTGEDGNTREVFVAYSLGNFTSNQNSEYTRDEVILNLEVKKGANGIYIEKIGYRPVYMNKQGTGVNTKDFQLIDIITYKKEFTQNGDEEAQNLYNTVQGSEEHIKMLLRGEALEDKNAKEIESSAVEGETTTAQNSQTTAVSTTAQNSQTATASTTITR